MLKFQKIYQKSVGDFKNKTGSKIIATMMTKKHKPIFMLNVFFKKTSMFSADKSKNTTLTPKSVISMQNEIKYLKF